MYLLNKTKKTYLFMEHCCLSLEHNIYIYICIYSSNYATQNICISIYSIYINICVSIHLFMQYKISVYLSIYLSIIFRRENICISIYLSNYGTQRRLLLPELFISRSTPYTLYSDVF